EDGDWGHIYVIIPVHRESSMEVRSQYYVIDPVLTGFNVEEPFDRGEAKDLTFMPNRDTDTERVMLNGPGAASTSTATYQAPGAFTQGISKCDGTALGAPTATQQPVVTIPGDAFLPTQATGEVAAQHYAASEKELMRQTLAMLEQDPQLRALHPPELPGQLRALLVVWDNPYQREVFLTQLAQEEMVLAPERLAAVSDLDL
ncbi:MAG TPA: hypothetical protein DCP28_24920, partial [Cytophagales bacterium]|nr:hypothetical protein [Cytophagales bacterium]